MSKLNINRSTELHTTAAAPSRLQQRIKAALYITVILLQRPQTADTSKKLLIKNNNSQPGTEMLLQNLPSGMFSRSQPSGCIHHPCDTYSCSY